MTQHFTLVDMVQEGNILTKRFTADDPFHFRNHSNPIEDAELVYDFDGLSCQVYLNPDQGSNLNGDAPDGERFLLSHDYPTLKTDKKIFEEALSIRALLTTEIEDSVSEYELVY